MRYVNKKRDKEKITPSTVEDDSVRYNRSRSTYTYSDTFPSDHYRSIDKTLDETKHNIIRGIEEARQEVPRNTQTVNDYQEQLLSATKEITGAYLDSQKEIIRSYQSVWAPYAESMYNTFWNNWVSPRRSAEVYSRTVSNFAENMLTATSLANNAMITNMEAARTAIQRRKNDMKEMTKIGVNTARTFEQTSKDAAEE